jgi:hypothetical protein
MVRQQIQGTTMKESSGVREVLFGLEEYLKFKDNEEQARFLREFVKILDSNDIQTAILEYCIKHLNEQDNKDKIFRSIFDYTKKVNNPHIYDAFSRSQIKSKVWLIEELARIDNHYDNIVFLAGWYGQLKSIYEKRLTYCKLRNVELDKDACNASDYIFNINDIDNYKVKAVCADINTLTLHKNGYEWEIENFKEGTAYYEKFLPDLIVNTSAEHMSEEWFHQLRFKQLESNPIVAVQSNNMFDGDGHVNCVHSIDHMKKKFPMKEILYEGELQLKGYKRVMLIGRP